MSLDPRTDAQGRRQVSLSGRIQSAWRAVGRFLKNILRSGKQRFTIMFIPHSEKRVLNLQLNTFALLFIAVIVVVVVGGAALIVTKMGQLLVCPSSEAVTVCAAPTNALPCVIVTVALQGSEPVWNALAGLMTRPPDAEIVMLLEGSPSFGVTLIEAATELPLPSMISKFPPQEIDAPAGTAEVITIAVAAIKVAANATKTVPAPERGPRSVVYNEWLTWSGHPSIWASGY